MTIIVYCRSCTQMSTCGLASLESHLNVSASMSLARFPVTPALQYDAKQASGNNRCNLTNCQSVPL